MIQNLDINQIYAVLAVIVITVILYIINRPNKTLKKTAKLSAPIPKKKVVGPFDMSEVSQHNKETDCWIIVDDKVYDITDYINDHPGGESILKNAGGDSSIGVHGPQHPPSMWDVLKLYYIGDLKH